MISWKKIFILIIAIIILNPNNTKAVNEIDTENIISEQETNFGIKEFLEEAETYSPDFIKDLNISDIFSKAVEGKIDNFTIIKKILSLLGSEVLNTFKVLLNILIVIIIHSILKALSDNLENSNISKIVYYAEYILIVTIIMANFSEILSSVNKTTENLIGFTRLLIPLLITLITYTGSITTSSVLEPILLFLIEFVSNLIKTLILPMVSIITVFIIVSKITDKVQISKLGSFMKSSVIWVLGIILTVFVGVLSLEGGLTASVDGVAAKTLKAAVSSVIPVVRKNSRR